MTKNSVLLVDDDEPFVRSLSFMLEAEGYDVSVALSGLKALEKIQPGSVDVVILDMLTPDLDGLEILRRTREVSPLTKSWS